nr:D(4) dopamine receptor-like [Cavia porcellus]
MGRAPPGGRGERSRESQRAKRYPENYKGGGPEARSRNRSPSPEPGIPVSPPPPLPPRTAPPRPGRRDSALPAGGRLRREPCHPGAAAPAMGLPGLPWKPAKDLRQETAPTRQGASGLRPVPTHRTRVATPPLVRARPPALFPSATAGPGATSRPLGRPDWGGEGGGQRRGCNSSRPAQCQLQPRSGARCQQAFSPRTKAEARGSLSGAGVLSPTP